MAVQDKFADEMLTDDELDNVAGGWYTFGVFGTSREYYEQAGIKIVENLFSADEFWYNGVDIGHSKATAVAIYFKVHNDTLPDSVEEAVKWEKGFVGKSTNKQMGYSCLFVKGTDKYKNNAK